MYIGVNGLMVYDSDGLISKSVVQFACFILLCSDRFPIVNQIAHCQSQQTRLFTVEKMVEIHCCGRGYSGFCRTPNC